MLLLSMLLLLLSLSMLLPVQSAGRRVPFALLEDVRGRLLAQYRDSWQQVGSFLGGREGAEGGVQGFGSLSGDKQGLCGAG